LVEQFREEHNVSAAEIAAALAKLAIGDKPLLLSEERATHQRQERKREREDRPTRRDRQSAKDKTASQGEGRGGKGKDKGKRRDKDQGPDQSSRRGKIKMAALPPIAVSKGSLTPRWSGFALRWVTTMT
jgi:ATP-dependent RNA helicase DeaD